MKAWGLTDVFRYVGSNGYNVYKISKQVDVIILD